MKKSLVALAAVPAMVMSLATAAPANAAYDAGRASTCAAIGGVYTAGNNASNDRCTVTTKSTAAPVASGTPTTSTLINDVGASYLSTLPVDLEEGEPVLTTATAYGDWAISYIVGVPSCTYAGKSKVQKCTSTTSAIETRDVFTITTITTPLYDVYEVLQDRQSVTTGTQPTTVTTTTRTVVYKFSNNSTAIANQQSDVSSDSSVAGDPIAINESGDVYTVTVGTTPVATAPDVDVLEPVLSGTEVTEPVVISTVKCIINGSTQTVRDNSCPEPTPVA
jgi:hypothetical protein